MTLMGDAVTGSVTALLAVPGLTMVAPYVTGKGIAWTPAELTAAAHLPQAPIDQGAAGSPVLTATIRDVEQFAWTVPAAVDRTGWTAARPTIYCNRNTLPAVLRAGWQGDLWLAIPGWQPGDPLPATPGCTIVAVQNDYSNPAYDLSAVLDPTWPAVAADPPKGNDMLLIQVPPGGSVPTGIYMVSGGRWHHVIDQESVTAYQAAGVQMAAVSAAEAAQLVADFPAGQPAVTVTPSPMTGTITLTPSA